MKFINTIKPHSKAEWSILLLVVILAVATAVLALTRQLVPAAEEDRAQLIAYTTPPVTMPTPAVTTPLVTQPDPYVELSSSLDQLGQAAVDFSTLRLKPMLDKLSDFQEEMGEKIAASEQAAAALAAQQAPAYVEPAPVETEAPTAAPTPSPEQFTIATQEGYTPVSGGGSNAPAGSLFAVPGIAGMPSGNTSAQGGAAGQGGAGAQAPPPAAPSAMPTADQVAMVQSGVLAQINATRASLGLGALAWDPTLQQIASQRAQELSVYYDSGHIRPDGSYSLTWISSVWGANYGISENIGYFGDYSRCDTSYIYNAFHNSPSHYAIMTYPTITKGAIGVYPAPDGKVYVSMNFGN